MAVIEILRNQNMELLDLLKELSEKIAVRETHYHISEIRDILSKLSVKLRIHLEMEEKILYPSLLDYPDNDIKELAVKYLEDLGCLAEAYKDYLKNWTGRMTVEERPAEFIYKTDQIVGLLLDRIYNEENILFPKLERVAL